MKPLSIIGISILLCWAGLRQTAPAAELALTEAERQELARLMQDLDSDDPETLDLALQALLAMGPKAGGAVDRLTEMLADARQFTYPTARYRSLHRTFQVNVSVVGVLRSIGPPAVPALVTALKNRDENVRLPAIQAIVELRQPVRLDVWLEAVEDSNPYVQFYAARELAKSKTPAAINALCKVLQDDKLEVRIEAAKALGEIGDEAAIGPLFEALPIGKVDTRLESAVGNALAKIGLPALKVLLEKFESLDENGRRMAGMAIAKVDAQQAKPLLQECLASEHWQVRGAAIEALATLRTPESLRIVTDFVDDPDWNVRWTAARWLGKLTDDESADANRAILLEMAKNDLHPLVRDHALWTLYFFPGMPTEDYTKTLEAALYDKSPRVRATAAISCSKFPHARFGPRLKELLNDPDGRVRAESAAALGNGNVLDAVPDLMLRLDDEDLQCVSYAAISLGKLGTDEAIEALAAKVRDLRSGDERRGRALQGLCFTENPKAIEPLAAALEDRSLRNYHLRAKNAIQELRKD